MQAHGSIQCRCFILRQFRDIDADIFESLEADLKQNHKNLKNTGKNRYYTDRKPARLAGPLPQHSPFYMSRPDRIEHRRQLIMELYENGSDEFGMVGPNESARLTGRNDPGRAG